MVVGGTVVGGTNVDDVGGSVVVVGGGGSVVPVVVATGGEVATGALVPTVRGAVVTTPARVVTAPPDGMVLRVVVLESTVDEVDVGALDVVVAPEVVEVGRAMVVVGAWVATCSLGDVSSPVVTSKSMAPSARAARTYRPTLNR
ncbi:MAG TPA: hypothetical protein VMZ73_03450 [Acidimicrobiales bacterium]|nr:hypothetical protein [Acidimicrobiales bacterium]